MAEALLAGKSLGDKPSQRRALVTAIEALTIEYQPQVSVVFVYLTRTLPVTV
jgi:hypothetical protein